MTITLKLPAIFLSSKFIHAVALSYASKGLQLCEPESNPIVRLCAQNQLDAALFLFYNSQTFSLTPPPRESYAALIHACAASQRLHDGVKLHQDFIFNYKNQPDLFVFNQLINMYCKCKLVDVAQQLFDEMPERNFFSYTILLTGFYNNNLHYKCFELFLRMLQHYKPNEFAIVSIISSCANESNSINGRQVHALAYKTSYTNYVYVANALIKLYSICVTNDSTDAYNSDAWRVFVTTREKNLITWNSMIQGFLVGGYIVESLNIFIEMRQKGYWCDRATVLIAISACSQCGSVRGINLCPQLHSFALKFGFTSLVEVATAIVSAYSKLGGSVEDCYKAFSEAASRDLVLWTGMICSLADISPDDAVLVFKQMRNEGFKLDFHAYSTALRICASMASEKYGSAFHGEIIKLGYERDIVIGNALIHVYARCGCLGSSEKVFELMQEHDIVSWNSMIKAYAIHGKGDEGLKLFLRMDLKPDSSTYIGLLLGCSHSGLVDEGKNVFVDMLQRNIVTAQCDHYACIVDMLGRAGRINEAVELINSMPINPDSIVWSALLAASQNHGETEIAKWAAQKLQEASFFSSFDYIQTSSMYCTSTGKFEEAEEMKNEMKNHIPRKKKVGLSWIEILNQMHQFSPSSND